AYDIEVENITIEVKDGKATISGTVPERHMKHRVEDIASMCSGVKDVDNQVRVSRSSGRGEGSESGSGSSAGSGSSSGSGASAS
ncbi:BON domain-containing protein, partial [Escherichia coli]|uniref:BON domain-containing protein n=1 Tax=Escherichia coli TaxID=562 RepID=UPI0021B199C9